MWSVMCYISFNFTSDQFLGQLLIKLILWKSEYRITKSSKTPIKDSGLLCLYRIMIELT